MGRSYLSGSEFHHHSMDLHDKIKNEKDEKIAPNQGNFGKIIGTKKDSDAVKIRSFGTGEAKHISFIPEDNIAETLRKISFKEKKKETTSFLRFKANSKCDEQVNRLYLNTIIIMHLSFPSKPSSSSSCIFRFPNTGGS